MLAMHTRLPGQQLQSNGAFYDRHTALRERAMRNESKKATRKAAADEHEPTDMDLGLESGSDSDDPTVTDRVKRPMPESESESESESGSESDGPGSESDDPTVTDRVKRPMPESESESESESDGPGWTVRPVRPCKKRKFIEQDADTSSDEDERIVGDLLRDRFPPEQAARALQNQKDYAALLMDLDDVSS